jgi:hypothetical protein
VKSWPPPPRDTPEERLLRAIFGERGGKEVVVIKIARTAKGLCDTCSSCVFIEGEGSQAIRHCEQVNRDIRFSVEACSGYNDRTATPLWEMKQTAWIIVPSETSPAKIGFVRPGTDEHKKALGREN